MMKRLRWRGRVRQHLLVALCAVGVGWACVVAAGEVRLQLAVDATALQIDQRIDQRIASEGVESAGLCSDEVFVRRVHLDLTGRLPEADVARAFIDDTSPSKRKRLIDQLVESRAFAKWQADQWDGFLFYGGGFVNEQIDVRPLTVWLEDQFAANRPWDEMAYEILTSTGRQHLDGRVTPYLSARLPEESTALVGRAFLGIRLDCAQCHNHPYAEYTHEDFWGMAAFFDKTRVDTGYGQFTNNEFLRARKSVGADVHVFEEDAPIAREKPVLSLDVAPKFLRGDAPDIAEDQPRRPVLAQWVTSPDNPYFAKAMVNRVWWQLFGMGLVNPVDDLSNINDPSHPELLDELAQAFVDSGYSVRMLFKAICNTRAYQRAGETPDHHPDVSLYAAAPRNVMTPEQLFAAIDIVLDRNAAFATETGKDPDPYFNLYMGRDKFLKVFRSSLEADALTYQAGIPQVLHLFNEPKLNQGITRAVRRVEAKRSTPEGIVEELYLMTYARRPNQAEVDRMLDFKAKFDGTEEQAYAAMLWALMNSAEFLVQT